MVRSLRKSLCSGFSTSTTPQGYSRPLTFFPLASICWLDPTTANGMLAWREETLKGPPFQQEVWRAMARSKSTLY